MPVPIDMEPQAQEEETTALGRMRQMDLNLLVALDALLREENVSKAAQNLGLTQSGMSRALRRLRDHFEDPLFVRTGRGMRPTPFARTLEPLLRRTLQEVIQVITARPGFDPSHARKTFHILSDEYSTRLLLPSLVRTLRESAPGIRLDINALDPNPQRALEDERVDLVLMPPTHTQGDHIWVKLVEEPHVCLARKEHPCQQGPLTLGRLAAHPQVVLEPEGRIGDVVDNALLELGLRRRVSLRTNRLTGLGDFLQNTDLVAIVPQRVAKALEQSHRLASQPLPLQSAKLTISMGFHADKQADPAHTWLREGLAQIARELINA